MCVDEADRVFFVCAFDYMLGVYTIREGERREVEAEVISVWVL